jgi:methionyl-tRNA formyltransferase
VSKKDFRIRNQEEKDSTYFPRLNSLNQGFIDWEWDCGEALRFIRAFDDPYCGASTFLNERRVFIICILLVITPPCFSLIDLRGELSY